MNTVKIEPFMITGIAVRTSNNNGQAAKDIGALWQKFMAEQVAANIPNKVDDAIYAVYTDYKSDHTEPYTLILGCKVDSFESAPGHMVSRHFIGGNHKKYTAKGDLTNDAVFKTWEKIWAENIDRSYTADIEVYGERAIDPSNGEADIFIAVNA